MELRQYQQAAVDAVYEHLRSKNNNPCIVLPTGCHAKNHPILMYDGTVKKVQDVKIGDQLMGPDSTPRNVLALARGREKMAKIIPKRGNPFIVNINHILSLVSTSEGKKAVSPSHQRGGEITNITVQEYLQKAKSWKHLRKLYRVAVDFPQKQNLTIPPHILGLLLGDGTLCHTIALTSADEELGDEFTKYVESLNCTVRISENDKGVPSYFCVNKENANNPLIDMINCMGLYGHRSQNKFIPYEYLVSSREDRLQLLAGLLDSDGYYDVHNLEFTTKSQELSDDVIFLARSLGFMANCVEKYSSCQTGAGGWYYRIIISGDYSVIPCRRKKHVFKVREQKKNVLRTGFSVEELPEDNFYGFALDGDHLYVDGYFMVHHNTGKSVVIAKIVQDAVENWNGRVLILAHVKELLEQNASKIKALCPKIPIGIFSAGLKSKDTQENVIVAGIQSVYNKACDLGSFDIILIDEAHLIQPSSRKSDDSEGMYRTFLKDMKIINPNVRLIGLTATPFRLKGGLICNENNLLNEVCYEAGLKEMIHQGYLSPLISRAGKTQAKLDNLHIRGGEFISSEIADVMNKEELTNSICREIVDLTKDRKSVLIFCTSVDHCKHVADKISYWSNMECEIVTGDTHPHERAEILQRFKGEFVASDLFGTPKPPLKFLANVSVLTTGFDAPNIDCVVMIRPTASAGLLIQCAGRGTRLSPQTGKESCLFLDYGENILRHGPLDMITVKDKTSGKGEAPAKKCPDCLALIHAAYTKCPDCGYEFPSSERSNLSSNASSEGVLSGQVSYCDYEVQKVIYSVHEKRFSNNYDYSKPKTMRIDYQVGFGEYKSEWVCPEHTGYARKKFEKWWRERAAFGAEIPTTTQGAVNLANSGVLSDVEQITTKTVAGERFERISKVKLKTRPILPEGWPFIGIGEEQKDFAETMWDVEDDDDIPF